MSVTTVVLPSTDESTVCLGFVVKLDSETSQLDEIYRALSQIPKARVEYLDSKRLRCDVVIPQNKV